MLRRRKAISQKTRKLVYEKYHGHCAYCGCKINLKDMKIDHMYSIYRDEYSHGFEPPAQENIAKLNDFNNLMPARRMCNFYKSTNTVDEFRQQLLDTLLPNMSKPFQFRLAQKYGLVTICKHPIQFYFEKKGITKMHCCMDLLPIMMALLF